MKILKCKLCGFILHTRPGLKEIDGVCLACINVKTKKDIDFLERQKWLTKYISQNITHSEYDCLVAVSGGKDSTVIVKKLFEYHGVKKALLVHLSDNFTHTETGKKNLENIINKFNCDLFTVHLNPAQLNFNMLKDFEESLNPLKWLEKKIYETPIEIAKNLGIKLVFYGENAGFEYGTSETLEIFHHNSTNEVNIIYMGAIYPYSAVKWFEEAKDVGFKELNVLNEWQRQGQIENYSQIDSIGYHMGIWTKFVKFGFQRVSDIACRMVRDGDLHYDQAQQLIKDKDYICDPASKRDFSQTIGISEEYFDTIVEKHANLMLVGKDINGQWKRHDLI